MDKEYTVMGETQSASKLTEYEIHDVLRNERRTQTLKCLSRTEEMMTVRELSERLAALETGETPPPRNIRESAYNSLHQVHLPKLDELGIVEYEQNRKLISLADGYSQVDLYIEAVSGDDIPWATYYWVLGVLALGTVVLSSIGTAAFAILSVPIWALLFFCLFVFSALYHIREGNWTSFRLLPRQ